MRTLSLGQKLKAISNLRIGEVQAMDWSDIASWCERVKRHGDTTCLDDKAAERIDSLYDEYFET
jgi:hypothetical protein